MRPAPTYYNAYSISQVHTHIPNSIFYTATFQMLHPIIRTEYSTSHILYFTPTLHISYLKSYIPQFICCISCSIFHIPHSIYRNIFHVPLSCIIIIPYLVFYTSYFKFHIQYPIILTK